MKRFGLSLHYSLEAIPHMTEKKSFFVDDELVPRGFEIDKLKRALEHDKRRSKDQGDRLRRDLDAWREKYRSQYRQILGRENVAIMEAARANRRRPSADAPRIITAAQKVEEHRRRRAESLDLTRRIGIDRSSFTAFHDAARLEFRDIVDRCFPVREAAEVTITETEWDEAPLDINRIVSPAPPPPAPEAPTTFAMPPYGAWWERGSDSYASGSGVLKGLNSWLWRDFGRSGSCPWLENKSASDVDYLMGWRQNGMLVPYTVPVGGVIKVQFDIECAWSEHRIGAYNEWGNSDYNAYTSEQAVVGVFWNWVDVTPAVEVVDYSLVHGLEGHGSGDYYPGTINLVPAGQLRTMTVFPQMSFPAGVTLWVYVGTQQHTFAYLNDVSCSLFANSGWHFKEIRITQA